MSIHLPSTSPSLTERISTLPEGGNLPIIEVRVGSDSDLPKIQKILGGLRDYPILMRIASAHRTPGAMTEFAKSFPDVCILTESDTHELDQLIPETTFENQGMFGLIKKLKVVLCIAAAGGSAHIAGMTASETEIPVIAFPVPSSTNGQYESDASMRDMPPGIPNGTSAYEEVIVAQAKAIYDRTRASSELIYITLDLPITPEIQALLEKIGLRVTDNLDEGAEIGIFAEKIDDTNINYEGQDRAEIATDLVKHTSVLGTQVAIVNPIYVQSIDTDDRTLANATRLGIITMNRLTTLGLSMGSSVQGKTNLTNSILYAAKIIAIHNEKVREALKTHRDGLSKVVRGKDVALVVDQLS